MSITKGEDVNECLKSVLSCTVFCYNTIKILNNLKVLKILKAKLWITKSIFSNKNKNIMFKSAIKDLKKEFNYFSKIEKPIF